MKVDATSDPLYCSFDISGYRKLSGHSVISEGVLAPRSKNMLLSVAFICCFSSFARDQTMCLGASTIYPRYNFSWEIKCKENLLHAYVQ